MGKVAVRDVNPFLQKLRNFLLGRTHISALRYEQGVASRSPPLPNLPEGPSHKLHTNYYYSRDGRREVQPPTVISKQALIGAGSEVTSSKLRIPGKVYLWD